MAGLGDVSLVPAGGDPATHESWPDCPWPVVAETSAAPVAACLAAQYAGWKVEGPGYFAMASGPMRAAIGREQLYDTIGLRERPAVAVGLLEAARLPPEDVCRRLAADARVEPDNLTLLVARTASRGRGCAPLPPVPAGDDLRAIGRTNDAILYGGHVVLEVDGPESDLSTVGPKVVSQASPAHGAPFLEVFERAGRDFYAIDPAIFAPARVDLVSTATGRTLQFGRCEPDLVARSFAG
jgi:methenyltetrahydromethanopterin cyclohydrolase